MNEIKTAISKLIYLRHDENTRDHELLTAIDELETALTASADSAQERDMWQAGFDAGQTLEKARACLAAKVEQEPIIWESGEEWEPLAFALCEEEHDDPHQLIYDGYPPEPWGEVWQKYEGDAKRMIQMVRKYTATHPQQEQTREPWMPYLSDRADGCKGRYAIARWNPNGYREVWNMHSHRWAAFSDEVLTLEQAHALMQNVTIPTAPQAQQFKGNEIAKVVNELRDIAIQYHGAQQLRERIAHVVVPLLWGAQAQQEAKDAQDAARLEIIKDFDDAVKEQSDEKGAG